MNADKKKRLEAAGFKFGTVGELFNLSEAEELLVEVKVALAEAIRELREVRSLSQADLAPDRIRPGACFEAGEIPRIHLAEIDSTDCECCQRPGYQLI